MDKIDKMTDEDYIHLWDKHVSSLEYNCMVISSRYGRHSYFDAVRELCEIRHSGLRKMTADEIRGYYDKSK